MTIPAIDQTMCNLRTMFANIAKPVIDMYPDGISQNGGRPPATDRAAFEEMLSQTVFPILDNQRDTIFESYASNPVTAAVIATAWKELRQIIAQQVRKEVGAKWFDA